MSVNVSYLQVSSLQIHDDVSDKHDKGVYLAGILLYSNDVMACIEKRRS